MRFTGKGGSFIRPTDKVSWGNFKENASSVPAEINRSWQCSVSQNQTVLLQIERETHSEKRCFRANASQSKACGQHVALKILALGKKKKRKMREMLIVKYITLVVGRFLSTVPKRCSSVHISFFCFWYADNNQYFNLLCLVDIQITLIKEHQNRREIFHVDQCHWITFTTWEVRQSQLVVRAERVGFTQRLAFPSEGFDTDYFLFCPESMCPGVLFWVRGKGEVMYLTDWHKSY